VAGCQVLAATGYMEPLTHATVGWASRSVSSKLQMSLLDQSKTVIESMQNLFVAAKDAGGNRKVIFTANLFLIILCAELSQLLKVSIGFEARIS